jgi:hypothetical protein
VPHRHRWLDILFCRSHRWRKKKSAQEVEQVLREEIRALEIEKALLGYVMACCAEDVAQTEMRDLLFTRVYRLARPALLKTEERCGVVLSYSGADFLHILSEEVDRIAERCIAQDIGLMSSAAAFTAMGTGSVN